MPWDRVRLTQSLRRFGSSGFAYHGASYECLSNVYQDVRVDLCRRDIGVAEEHLHGAEIGCRLAGGKSGIRTLSPPARVSDNTVVRPEKVPA